MSYQVIARKYRPQRFSDVVGQEHVTRTLANAIQQNRIAHAYLFCGPRGTGKTTIARIFAKCLNCTGGRKADFDDADPRCREIAEGRSLDVIEIDGASNRGIEEIRELRDTVKYAPSASKHKIYIIDEVHMLTKEAFNALLKTLEATPAHVKFMFATTEPEKVLPTILSRCQRFALRRIPVALIVKHLGDIARLENVQIDDAALHAIARGADGGMRDAECALDQLISFCGEKIVEEDVLSMFGLTAQSQILALSGAVLKGDSETVLRELNDLSKHGKDLGRLLADVLSHLRNLLVYQVSKGDLRLLEASESEAAGLKAEAALISTDSLTRVMEVLTDFESRLREAASKKIFIEVALLKAIQIRNAVSIDTVITELQQLRGANVSSAAERSPSPPAGERAGVRGQVARETEAARVGEPISTMRETTASSPSPLNGERAGLPAEGPAKVGETRPISQTPTDLERLWQDLLEAVGRASAFTRSYLLEARALSFEKDVLTIGYDPEFADQMDLANNAKTHSLLQTKLKELGRPNAQIRFIKAESPPLRAAAEAVSLSPIEGEGRGDGAQPIAPQLTP